jgi:endonuclease/exonuclease/phosphatase family metal-dependent hydrolase
MSSMTRVAAASVALLAVWVPRNEAARSTIRVMTYNIHHGEGADGRFDLGRVASVMKRADPDLVALQEVDVGTARSGRVNQVAELQRLTGFHAAFGKAMDYDGGAYGVAVLSRWPIVHGESRPLPDLPDREPRTAFTVRVRTGAGGSPLRFTSTHLDQGRDEENRLLQAAALNELLARDDEPTILAGDMNARGETGVIALLRSKWADVMPSAPNIVARPRVRDFVLYRPAESWRVVDARIIDDMVASDHRPVFAELEWTDGR